MDLATGIRSFATSVLPGFEHTEWRFLVDSICRNVDRIQCTKYTDVTEVTFVHSTTLMVDPSASSMPKMVRMHLQNEEPIKIIWLDAPEMTKLVGRNMMWYISSLEPPVLKPESQTKLSHIRDQARIRAMEWSGGRPLFLEKPGWCVPMNEDWELAVLPAMCAVALSNGIPLLFDQLECCPVVHDPRALYDA